MLCLLTSRYRAGLVCSLRFLLASLVLLIMLPQAGRAQAPGWAGAVPGSFTQTAGSGWIRDVAPDATGNMIVVGSFSGQVAFGSTMLTSAGSVDAFVAKYLPATDSWAWAQSAGGVFQDVAQRVAVSGNAIYVTGYLTNSTTNAKEVRFGGTGPTTNTAPQYGAASGSTSDLFLAKYTDNGTGATFQWSQIGGGDGQDQGMDVAVSGNNVYVTGILCNTTADDHHVVFGGTGATPGATVVRGASASNNWLSDMVLVKYIDNGSSATLGWTQVGGGADADSGTSLIASSNSVYVVGSISNSISNAQGVVFGGDGTTPGTVRVNGASSATSRDMILVKYQDTGSSAVFQWSQVGGGSGLDTGSGVAISGSNVYVVGSYFNSRTNANLVMYGGDGITPGTVQVNGSGSRASSDLILVKYTDNGSSASLGWTQVGGGGGADVGVGVAVNGASVYVVGSVVTNASNNQGVVFGGDGTTPGTVQVNGVSSSDLYGDVVVARYTDKSTTASLDWTQVGGGGGSDYGFNLASNGSTVYLCASISKIGSEDASAYFGTATGSPVLGVAGTRPVLAQLDGGNGTWQRVTVGFAGGTSQTQAVAADAQGNLFLTGYFTGQVYVGGTLLSSVNDNDLFVAKYSAASRTWAWAQSGGGTGNDQGLGIAVDGSNVYVTGTITNSTSNASGVLLGGTDRLTATTTQLGATSTVSQDVLLAKYIDNGSSATVGWTQIGGGTGADQGSGVAVGGAGVYVTGAFTNSASNGNSVVFGGSGTALGTVQVNGASSSSSQDALLLKYTDNGSTAALSWTQVGGGKGADRGYGVAVNGLNVYVTGAIQNNTSNSEQVLFGGSGTAPSTASLKGASGTDDSDLLLAKYTDSGNSAALGWAQIAGGTGADQGNAVAVSGNSLYVTGSLTNNTANGNGALFGGDGTTTGTATVNGASSTASQDLLLAKWTDNGSSATYAWSQVGGGTGADQGTGVALNGSSLYVTGSLTNDAVNSNAVAFGSDGTTAGTATVNGASGTAGQDILLAKYIDNGSTGALNWAQAGGGAGSDTGNGIAVSGRNVLPVGYVTPGASFGPTTIASPFNGRTAILARAIDNTLAPLPVRLVEFTATASGPAAARLAWTTASEINSQRFEVERSLDGGNYLKIGELAAVGSSGTRRTYAYQDEAAPTGQLYYRLRQVDQDGMATYSPVRSVTLGGAPSLALHPNPTRGAATLHGVTPGQVVQVIDALGRPVAVATADAAGTAALGGLAPGLYLVRAGRAAVRLVVE